MVNRVKLIFQGKGPKSIEQIVKPWLRFDRLPVVTFRRNYINTTAQVMQVFITVYSFLKMRYTTIVIMPIVGTIRIERRRRRCIDSGEKHHRVFMVDSQYPGISK